MGKTGKFSNTLSATQHGGMNLPLLSTLHKTLQVSYQSQLLTSRDSCVCHLAERNLKQELSLSRKKFRPATMVRYVLSAIPDSNRKSLCKVAKAITSESGNSTMLENLHSLERQGHMSRNLDPHCASPWATAVLSRPEEEMKFAINAALDTLPYNNNLHLWKKRKDSICPLCKQNQTLLHVLNNCSYARDCRRYNKCHDAVFQEIVSTIRPKLPSSTQLTTNIGTDYSFPLHIIL